MQNSRNKHFGKRNHRYLVLYLLIFSFFSTATITSFHYDHQNFDDPIVLDSHKLELEKNSLQFISDINDSEPLSLSHLHSGCSEHGHGHCCKHFGTHFEESPLQIKIPQKDAYYSKQIVFYSIQTSVF